jgi:hypothetical protein
MAAVVAHNILFAHETVFLRGALITLGKIPSHYERMGDTKKNIELTRLDNEPQLGRLCHSTHSLWVDGRGRCRCFGHFQLQQPCNILVIHNLSRGALFRTIGRLGRLNSLLTLPHSS